MSTEKPVGALGHGKDVSYDTNTRDKFIWKNK